MILRFRGKDGAFRVEAEPKDTFADVVARLEVQLPPHTGIAIGATPSAAGETANARWQQPVASLGLKHGDLLFFNLDSATKPEPPKPKLPKLDEELANDPGLIPRQRSSLCSHGPKGMCEYCQPLEPYDEEYRYEHGIKHLSFWAQVKKLQADAPAGVTKVLEEPFYSVKPNCPGGHLPWPQGICSKCQPAAITLQQQKFRMVDHVEFSQPSIVSDFIDFWRQTNAQRIGFLIGTYEKYDAVPLGVKAVVSAIWEADQEDENDSLLLKELPTKAVHDAAHALGQQVVGVIFTDLVDSGKGDGSVVNKRHAHSYFLSSLEVALASRMQNQFPYKTPLSETDEFSSRFVTAVVSGNERGEIDVACYQASLQAQAMVKADLVVPSTNPSVMRIKPPSDTRYVPDIFYKHVNEYKLTVQENAKPAFPVDYLLVSLTHGFPDDPKPPTSGFPIENRPALRTQSVHQLAERLDLGHGFDTANLADFHLLAYLYSLGVLQGEEQNVLVELLAGERQGRDITGLATQLAHGPGLATLRAIAST